MKFILVIVTLFLFNADVTAQKKYAISFHSYNSAGFVFGRSPASFAAETENGIKIKTWFIGAGFGIDNYYRQTLPLFGAIKKEFLLKENRLFLYAKAGRNLIAKDKTKNVFFSSIKTQGGFYGDAGIGYKIKMYKNNHLYFTVGNSLKHITETETFPDNGFPYYYTTKRKFSRIAIKVGLQF